MKILALHGYTQSGGFFRHKLQKLQQELAANFPNVEFRFPTGPIHLVPSESTSDWLSKPLNVDDDEGPLADPDDIDAFGWHVLHGEQDPPYGVDQSLEIIADILRTEGPFDGILGFSQGSVLGVLVASLLEGDVRRQTFERAKAASWPTMPYPRCFENLDHPPLKFGITYGALMGRGPFYAPFYENPLISTPFLHFTGLFDPVVPAEMTQAVADAKIGGDDCTHIDHPGSHFVPTSHEYLQAVVDFVARFEAPSVSSTPPDPILELRLEHFQNPHGLHPPQHLFDLYAVPSPPLPSLTNSAGPSSEASSSGGEEYRRPLRVARRSWSRKAMRPSSRADAAQGLKVEILSSLSKQLSRNLSGYTFEVKVTTSST